MSPAAARPSTASESSTDYSDFESYGLYGTHGGASPQQQLYQESPQYLPNDLLESEEFGEPLQQTEAGDVSVLPPYLRDGGLTYQDVLADDETLQTYVAPLENSADYAEYYEDDPSVVSADGYYQ